MSNCQTDIPNHKRAASSQNGRMPKALHSDFVLVDERSIADLIVSTNTLSKQLKFYNQDNVVLDNWSPFFQWETTSILAQIATLNIDKILSEFQLKKRELLFIPLLAGQKDIIFPFFYKIEDTLKDLFNKVEQLPHDFLIKEYYKGTYKTIKKLLKVIMTEIESTDDLSFSLQHHIFNKNIQNLFGLLTQWKTKSEEKLLENLESYPKHAPQYALYLAFLKLFGFAQQNLNEFTERHLDFYYKKILQLTPEVAQPDYAHLYIEPHKGIDPFLLEEGNIFLGGKDGEGNKKYYAATADTVINQAAIANLYGALKLNNKYYFEDITGLNASGESWKPFPESELSNEIGFVLASPMLFLRGGSRLIHVSFINAAEQMVDVNAADFNFYLSGAEEWHLVTDVTLDEKKVVLPIAADVQEIVPFNPEIHEGVAIDTKFPVLKVVANDSELTHVSFQKIKIEVLVRDYNHFKLYSETGEIDHTKSFQPFGPLPRKENGFVFACNEYFQKKGAYGALKVITDRNWNWYLPYYTRLSFLENGRWTSGSKWEWNPNYNMINTQDIPYDFSENREIAPNDASGYAKMILTSSNYSEDKYLEDFITAAKVTRSTTLPYVPTVNEIMFDYYAAETMDVGKNTNADNHGFYHLYPNGYKALRGSTLTLLPVVENEGELIIGISDIAGGNAISLLFQVAEGSANPRQTPIDLKWTYLHENKWEKFEEQDLGDETNGLTQSGIVKINAPEELVLDQQTILPPNYWWIKIAATQRVDAICDLVGIHAQALKVILTDYDNVGTYFIENTPSKTITKLFNNKNEIKKVKQPYASFGGKLKETSNLFYQRVSERLRHKGKAISVWDYEKLILDNFAEVYQVKCLNHHRYDSIEIANMSAGYVTLIPVAKGNTLDVPNFWKPIVDLGTMKRIKTFLQERTSPHVRIAVKPPTLEKLELDFRVKYIEIPGADTRLYTQQLQDTINKFLSPWAYSEDVVANFQEEIEKSRLIQLIEQQTYVDYIADFKVNQLILEETTEDIKQRMNDVDKIIPKTAYSLFIPHNQIITTMTKECCL